MISKACIVFLSMIVLVKTLSAQSAWPIIYYPSENGRPLLHGYIIFNNNDTLRGFIKAIPYGPSRHYLPIILDSDSNRWNPSSVKGIPTSNIRVMFFSKVGPFTKSPIYKYARIDSNHIWQVVGEKGTVKVCENSINGSDSYGQKMVLIGHDGKTVKLYSFISYILHWGGREKMLRNFIKRRYHVQQGQLTSKSGADLINIILEKESEKQ